MQFSVKTKQTPGKTHNSDKSCISKLIKSLPFLIIPWFFYDLKQQETEGQLFSLSFFIPSGRAKGEMNMNWCVVLSLRIFTTNVYSQRLNIKILFLPGQLYPHTFFFFFITMILLTFLSNKKNPSLWDNFTLVFSFLSH